jgi:hypothetical protein
LKISFRKEGRRIKVEFTLWRPKVKFDVVGYLNEISFYFWDLGDAGLLEIWRIVSIFNVFFKKFVIDILNSYISTLRILKPASLESLMRNYAFYRIRPLYRSHVGSIIFEILFYGNH